MLRETDFDADTGRLFMLQKADFDADTGRRSIAIPDRLFATTDQFYAAESRL